MTTPKQALERARTAINAIVLSTHSVSFKADLDAIDEALASLQGEDAVERVAQAAQAFWQSPSGRSWIECCEKLPQQAEWFRRLARAIIATGLVPDEAAIRADEREKCAARFRGKDIWTGEAIAAAIRSGGGE